MLLYIIIKSCRLTEYSPANLYHIYVAIHAPASMPSAPRLSEADSKTSTTGVPSLYALLAYAPSLLQKHSNLPWTQVHAYESLFHKSQETNLATFFLSQDKFRHCCNFDSPLTEAFITSYSVARSHSRENKSVDRLCWLLACHLLCVQVQVLQRGERIELLVDKTDDLRNQVCHVTSYYIKATLAADASSIYARTVLQIFA
jgi:hypothetical protein